MAKMYEVIHQYTDTYADSCEVQTVQEIVCATYKKEEAEEYVATHSCKQEYGVVRGKSLTYGELFVGEATYPGWFEQCINKEFPDNPFKEFELSHELRLPTLEEV